MIPSLLLVLLSGAGPASPDLCAERPEPSLPCHPSSPLRSGESPAGKALAVVEVAWHERGEAGRTPSPECAPFSWFLLEEGRAREILRSCNDGYGAAGLGEDEIRVQPNRFIHQRSGGSAWRWSSTRTFSLSPLALLEERWSGYWSLGPNREEGSWNETTRQGSVSWYSPRCEEDGAIPDNAQESPSELPFQYAPIPSILPTPLLTGQGWAGQDPGVCGLHLDASGQGGFVVHGAPSSAGDASMDLLAMKPAEEGPAWLLVELQDDRWVLESERPSTWLHTDHLELWLGQALSCYDHCLNPEKPVQYAILLDGSVVPASGSPPKDLRVDVDRTAERIRLRISIPRGLSGLTLVYSDSDDGRSQERLIATSRLRFGRAETLGHLREVEACESGSALRWVLQLPPLE